MHVGQRITGQLDEQIATIDRHWIVLAFYVLPLRCICSVCVKKVLTFFM